MSSTSEGVTCPICHTAEFNAFLVCQDHTTTGELFHVEQCPHCKLLITNPRPIEQTSARYYQSPKYISHTDNSTDPFGLIYQIIKSLAIKWKYSLLQKHNQGTRILDIGCGTGSFIEYCKKQGKQVQGVEPSSAAKEVCDSKKLSVVSQIQELPNHQFDIITLWHVLEHLYDLHGTMQFLTQHIDQHGTIFIAVPNHESFDAKHYGQYWAAYDVPRHLWHFSKSTMKTLADQYQLKIRAIYPMKLDAYYVSLLSEKYLNKKLTVSGIIRAIIAGFKSNRRAADRLNYSSLIYVMSK